MHPTRLSNRQLFLLILVITTAMGVTADFLLAARTAPSSRPAVDRYYVRHDGSIEATATGQRRKILVTRQSVSFIAFHLVAESDHD